MPQSITSMLFLMFPAATITELSTPLKKKAARMRLPVPRTSKRRYNRCDSNRAETRFAGYACAEWRFQYGVQMSKQEHQDRHITVALSRWVSCPHHNKLFSESSVFVRASTSALRRKRLILVPSFRQIRKRPLCSSHGKATSSNSRNPQIAKGMYLHEKIVSSSACEMRRSWVQGTYRKTKLAIAALSTESWKGLSAGTENPMDSEARTTICNKN
jgi:hypothetical protein